MPVRRISASGRTTVTREERFFRSWRPSPPSPACSTAEMDAATGAGRFLGPGQHPRRGPPVVAGDRWLAGLLDRCQQVAELGGVGGQPDRVVRVGRIERRLL